MLAAMETDSFFCNLFKQLPQTLFELIELPSDLAKWYRFDAVELKKALRIDGLMKPIKRGLPLYFVEVQFHMSASFYANLFAKVFCYLEENDPGQEWVAVAIFGHRGLEPTQVRPYQALLDSNNVYRVYLDELNIGNDPPIGLGILQLAFAAEDTIPALLSHLKGKTKTQIADADEQERVIELTEGILLRRFTQYDREEVRKMFQLHDLRESKVWQEAHQTGIDLGIKKGREEGIEKGKLIANRELALRCLAQNMSTKQVADLLAVPVSTVRRWAKAAAK